MFLIKRICHVMLKTYFGKYLMRFTALFTWNRSRCRLRCGLGWKRETVHKKCKRPNPSQRKWQYGRIFRLIVKLANTHQTPKLCDRWLKRCGLPLSVLQQFVNAAVMQFSRYALQKYIYFNILRHRLLSSAYNARDKTVPYGGTGNIEIFKGEMAKAPLEKLTNCHNTVKGLT